MAMILGETFLIGKQAVPFGGFTKLNSKDF